MEFLNKNDKFCLEWRNLSYVPRKKMNQTTGFNIFKRNKEDEVRVLDNVHGSIESGSLVAVLGASGCGKTSLLAAVSHRIRRDLSGDVFINGRLLDAQEMRTISGYVPQSDISIPTITSYEHLYFMLQFKNGKTLSKSDKKQQIYSILTKLSLIDCVSTPIKHLSGGEKRKLLLATSLIFDPLLLFCDEITTGLDSFQASSVIQSLRTLVGLDSVNNDDGFSSKKAVICSVHQPSSSLFHLFSHLILLSSNGKIVYQGKIEDAVTTFSNAGMPCPSLYNPAEFYVKMVSQDDFRLRQVTKLSDKVIDGPYQPQESIKRSNNRIGWFKQLFLLILRSLISGRRNYKKYLIQSALYLSTSFVIGLLYGNVTPNTQASVQDITGALFTLINEIVFTYSYFVVFLIPEQYSLLRRETGEDLYTISAFYVSKIIILIPKVILETFIFVGVVTLLTTFDMDFYTYLRISTSLIFSGITAMAYGFSLSGIFESVRLTIELGPPLDLFLLILGGIYINVSTIAIPALKYVSLFFYANDAISYDYWKGVQSIACSPDKTEYPCLKNGTEVLEHLGFGTDSSTLVIDYLGLAVLFVVGHTLGFLGIRRIVKKEGFY